MKKVEMQVKFVEALAKYLAVVELKYINYLKDYHFTHLGNGKGAVSYEEGSKYVKVMVGNHIHTFVEKINGDILKARNWNSPAVNGVRGNIYSKDSGASVVDHYGAKYLR